MMVHVRQKANGNQFQRPRVLYKRQVSINEYLHRSYLFLEPNIMDWNIDKSHRWPLMDYMTEHVALTAITGTIILLPYL